MSSYTGGSLDYQDPLGHQAALEDAQSREPPAHSLTQSLGFPEGPAITLGQGLSEGAPGMEAASEGMLLVTLTDQA